MTGVYAVTHYQHRMPHEVFAKEGELFPVCRRCTSRVSFTLIQPAVHLSSDPDFAATGDNAKSASARTSVKKSN
ncbi:MAG TPA: hypothetical protein VE783_07810 [Candidatus Limnocylindrales bacterium]|nr:hypothetical protein [Candidatus Limnocylindrales bacterium]